MSHKWAMKSEYLSETCHEMRISQKQEIKGKYQSKRASKLEKQTKWALKREDQ